MSSPQTPVMLIVLDGWGLRDDMEGNALKLANLPNFHRLWETYPHTSIQASGEYVGLPKGQIGNSEVGHLNIGAGRVVYQELTRISKAVETGELEKNPVLAAAMDRLSGTGKALHLMGLLSDGGVHSHIDHLFALLDMAVAHGVDKIFVHAFLDGRDVPPANAKEYVEALDKKLAQIGVGQLATISGRYYAMDRDKRWERVKRAWDAIVYGEGEKAPLGSAAVETAYHARLTDEFVLPTVIIDEKGEPRGTVADGDSVIFFNFRADRARQLSHVFTDQNFDGFDRGPKLPQVHFVCMTQYDITLDAPVAFLPQNLENTFGEVVSRAGMRQLRIAETEKYAHVTFFFNGGVEEPNEGEDRVLVPSPKVATYNLQPEMSANEVTDRVVEKINSKEYPVIVLNLANPDMVGHTGILPAAIQAVETVDGCLGRIVPAVLDQDGVVIITADHGNVEQMIDPDDGGPQTAHTTNPVPVILVSDRHKDKQLRSGGALEDIAPTMIELLRLEKPLEMTGKSLIMS
ncbi:2,3-bisphosphoglycerate-independent phosphoglycerate mutase [Heliobacillus mobilis]|uniref:2,3-bisphosphoglycerate-independent phosphoglycerate mutase n=2 Tax=Heliobacterium mobile TaxID=28064 RepID=A0A6I3SN42_HELMO|nr:2,3-bisphosphoglycerate-independent phosphoglycerate mutase [Heliobacterium mobile]